MMTDPIADMLTRIRNANVVRKRRVVMPASRMKVGIAEVLKEAGFMKAPTVVITPHDDDMNVYLTIYCRMLRPDVEIISRSSHERTISTLHRAGCGFVISYASVGANAVFNLLRRTDLIMVAEGLHVFKMKVPAALRGKTIAETELRQTTGCTILSIHRGDSTLITPGRDAVLEPDDEIVMIGTVESENRYLERYAS